MLLISLAHPITEMMPRWPNDPQTRLTQVASVEHDGYFLRKITIGEHSGTHMNAAKTFDETGDDISQISPVFCPLVVAHVQRYVNQNAAYCFDEEALSEFEAQQGKLPEGCFFILNTGWYHKWGKPKEFLGQTEGQVSVFPHISFDAVNRLIKRGIIGVGIDTHGIDSPKDPDYCAQKHLLKNNKLALECLANLDNLPEKGAWIMVSPLPVVGGSGSPIAPVAFVPT